MTFGQKCSKLNSRLVYCSQLYGIRDLVKNVNHFNILFRDIYPREEPPPFILEEDCIDWLENAKKIEADMYKMADSRPEYYHLVVEQIFVIRKQLEEKRKERRRQILMGYRYTSPFWRNLEILENS